MRTYFGTDGIRGRANSWPMNAQTALKVGMAAGRLYRHGDYEGRVVIGKDTRLSGYMIEQALVSGFLSAGMNVFQFGPLPTPAVAMLTHSLRADLGVMISASHNPFYDNGIKLFGPDGYKLSDERELEIETLIENGAGEGLAPPDKLGRAKRIEDAQARYIELAKGTLPRALRLDGLRLVVDCANGAGYRVAPEALWELGAEVITTGVEPNGFNVNEKCGSTAPERACAKVCEMQADAGIALDGDADRVILIDEKGEIIDGDRILALIAHDWTRAGRLKGEGVVSTVMCNLGCERYLAGIGLDLIRAKVGDRYVVERMRKGGYNIGGEPSGHIVLNEFTTTGDGLIAALQVLSIAVASGGTISELCALFDPVPQTLRNILYHKREDQPLDRVAVKTAIAAGRRRLGKNGRLVVRPSGTEPVIRVMGEGDNNDLVSEIVDDIADAIERTDL